ncbi:hypothetical protein MKX67_18280 [Cytobacillus sp. FSL W7-1323]|uniref:hypothetical protein n=1 Tax=Cytobacillus sp. FSL W7-1323 TaxID=2921700 RepID=UPI00315818E5
MMEQYIFIETSSRNITENGEQFRVVNFRGTDQSSIPNEQLNVDGSFTMPIMDYFMAGVEGRLSEVIKTKVLGRLSPEAE